MKIVPIDTAAPQQPAAPGAATPAPAAVAAGDVVRKAINYLIALGQGAEKAAADAIRLGHQAVVDHAAAGTDPYEAERAEAKAAAGETETTQKADAPPAGAADAGTPAPAAPGAATPAPAAVAAGDVVRKAINYLIALGQGTEKAAADAIRLGHQAVVDHAAAGTDPYEAERAEAKAAAGTEIPTQQEPPAAPAGAVNTEAPAPSAVPVSTTDESAHAKISALISTVGELASRSTDDYLSHSNALAALETRVKDLEAALLEHVETSAIVAHPHPVPDAASLDAVAADEAAKAATGATPPEATAGDDTGAISAT